MAHIGVSAPLRLLRETWRNPTMLAQELYAMFTSREPAVREGPVEIRVGRGETGLTITQSERPAEQAGNALAATRARPPASATPEVQFESRTPKAFDGFSPRPAATEAPRPSPNFTPPPAPERDGFKPYESPAFKVNGPVQFVGSPVQFYQPPVIFNPQQQVFQPLVPPQVPIPPPEVAYGVVTGGSGTSWTVTITDSTSGGSVGQSFSVTAIGVLSSEEAPKGVTVGPLTPVDRGGPDKTYIYTPPIWL